MIDEGYTATPLWQATLAPRKRDEQGKARELLRVSYEALRKNVSTLLAEASRSTPDFTVHDITHVDALWETASLVCGDTNTLTPAEAYVLGCAFVLHDAAMGLAAYPDGLIKSIGEERWRDLLAVEYYKQNDCWPDTDDLDEPPSGIVDRCLAQGIRECHAKQAKRLVDQQWVSSAGNALYLIEDVHLREMYGSLIGYLAASHWWGVDSLADGFRQPRGSLPEQPADWIIEPLKLACILRLADAAQIDGRRAPTFLFALRDPTGLSHQHWRFQEHISRPQLAGDRIIYTAMRPFQRNDTDAWWLALDYLREVDQELKRVDSLLYDLGRPRLAARAVAGVDSPERFADLLPVEGWRPIDAALQISDVPRLVGTLGGEQLYGYEPEVAVRELIQNAHDAVLARQTVDSEFSGGLIDLKLVDEDDGWILEVRDNGVGMDESIIVNSLLDFGSSGWSSNQTRMTFPGLAGSGFKPRGRFGIGFFSIFILGDHVELTTRRYDGAYQDARRLTFDGLDRRALITVPEYPDRAPQGTIVRVVLKEDPYGQRGIFRRRTEGGFFELMHHLVIENSVPICIADRDGRQWVHDPIDLAHCGPETVFDRLYPPAVNEDRWPGRAELRAQIRTLFAQRATELLDSDGNRIGLAALGGDLYYRSQFNYRGVVTVNGFLADESTNFMGYVNGLPGRASRDKAEFAATVDEIRGWLTSQERKLREIGAFDDAMQLELAFVLHRARLGQLSPDHAVALTREGILRVGDVARWAAAHNEVFLADGVVPLVTDSRPPSVRHFFTGADIPMPPGWTILYGMQYGSEFTNKLDIDNIRDQNYRFASDQNKWTWENRWWWLSGYIEGAVIGEICRAWSCSIRDVLGPIAKRGWNDYALLDGYPMEPVFGYWLRRPLGNDGASTVEVEAYA